MTLLNIGFNFFAKLRRGSFLTPTSAYRNVSKENIINQVFNIKLIFD